MPLRQAK